jgi:hypothetical protein
MSLPCERPIRSFHALFSELELERDVPARGPIVMGCPHICQGDVPVLMGYPHLQTCRGTSQFLSEGRPKFACICEISQGS